MAFTEFYVTHGSSASDTNGGGPRLGSNDAPVYTTADSTVVAGALTTVVDNTGSPWNGVQVDDFIAFNPSGSTYEYRRVTALAPGGDATKITVSANCTAAANRTTKVGGAFSTLVGAGNAVYGTSVNAAGDKARINVKADSTWTTNNAWVRSGVTIQGYGTTPGDGTRATVQPAASDSLMLFRLEYQNTIVFRHLIINYTLNQASWGPLWPWADVCYNLYVLDCTINRSYWGYATNSAMTYRALFWNVEFIKCQVKSLDDEVFIGCKFTGATSTETYIPATRHLLALNCIFVGTSSSSGRGIQVADGYFCQVFNCTFYNLDRAIQAYVYAVSYSTHTMGNNLFVNVANAFYSLAANGIMRTPKSAFYNVTNKRVNLITDWPNTEIYSGPDIDLSGDPFTDAANGDFSLNTTAGAGAACRGAGYPGALLDGVNVGYTDVGALQHADPSVPSDAEIAQAVWEYENRTLTA